jgi:hypothetical protein
MSLFRVKIAIQAVRLELTPTPPSSTPGECISSQQAASARYIRLNTPQSGANIVPLLHFLGPLPVSEEWAGWQGEEQEEKGFRRKLRELYGKGGTDVAE